MKVKNGSTGQWPLTAGLLACLLAGISCALEAEQAGESMRIASWNVQTLFDGVVNGSEYDDFGAASDWDAARFQQRLEGLKDAFDVFCEAGLPTVLVLQEIENEETLTALRRVCLDRRGYRWQAWAGRENGALGVGVLSRVPLAGCRTHVLASEEEPDLRPVFECIVQEPGGDVRLFACHWKSKLGGARETEALRRGAAGLINRRIRALRTAGDRLPNLVLGDFNCNPDEFSRTGEEEATAILPVSHADRGLPGSGLSLLLGDRAHAERADGRLVFMSPWQDSVYEGSYYYDGEWERIDQFLLGPGFFGGDSWVYRGFTVLETAPFVRDGVPFRFAAHNGLGCSDHLPIAVDFVRVRAHSDD